MPMDVRGILEHHADELLDIDLDCLEDELLLGEYGAAYARRCRTLIANIRKRRAQEGLSASYEAAMPADSDTSGAAGTVVVPADALSPFGAPRTDKALSPRELVARDLAVLRRSSEEEKDLAEYLAKPTLVDEAFVDQHIDLFDEVELRVIVRRLPLSEAFLEKYFDVLDHKAISECQCFSEEFFIRHYADLDVMAVLRRGPNGWRHKDRRSDKLDVFLRLKGVRI